MRVFVWMALAAAASGCGRVSFAELEPGEYPCVATEWVVERTVDELTSNNFDWSPAWGQGTEQIVLESNRGANAGNTELYLARFDPATGLYAELRELDELNTPKKESGPTISEDGLEIFFTREDDIMRATRAAPTDRFGPAEIFQTGGVAPDLGNGDLDLIYTITPKAPTFVIRTRSAPGSLDFGPPRTLEELVLTQGMGWPSLSHDGLELYFEANENNTNLPAHFASRRSPSEPFSAPAPIVELGSAADPDISPDGKWLLFVSTPTNAVTLARRTCKNP